MQYSSLLSYPSPCSILPSLGRVASLNASVLLPFCNAPVSFHSAVPPSRTPLTRTFSFLYIRSARGSPPLFLPVRPLPAPHPPSPPQGSFSYVFSSKIRLPPPPPPHLRNSCATPPSAIVQKAGGCLPKVFPGHPRETQVSFPFCP